MSQTCPKTPFEFKILIKKLKTFLHIYYDFVFIPTKKVYDILFPFLFRNKNKNKKKKNILLKEKSRNSFENNKLMNEGLRNGQNTNEPKKCLILLTL